MAADKSRLSVLAKEGWTMRFAAGEPRLSEAVDMYKDAGFEVRLEPLPKGMQCGDCTSEEEEGQCSVCFNGHEDQYHLIFTRPVRRGTRPEEDLF